MSAHPTPIQAAAQLQANTLFASLELSKARWLVTVSAPGSDKLSRHARRGRRWPALLDLLARLQDAAARRTGAPVEVIVIQEAGLDGFWLHRLLEQNGITSHVVDPASIAVNRRHRRAKTDTIDGEKLLRTLMAWTRGERRVCSMVRPPSPEEEDRRRLTRERATLLKERIQHTNRIKGLLSGQGIPTTIRSAQDRLARLGALETGDGRPLPERLKAEIRPELERVELVASQIAAVERERDALIGANRRGADAGTPRRRARPPQGDRAELGRAALARGAVPPLRQPAADRGLCGPGAEPVAERWASTASRASPSAGNPRLRHAMVELAWFWLRHQPGSALSAWFRRAGRARRAGGSAGSRSWPSPASCLVALWRYVTQGVVPQGAALKA